MNVVIERCTLQVRVIFALTPPPQRSRYRPASVTYSTTSTDPGPDLFMKKTLLELKMFYRQGHHLSLELKTRNRKMAAAEVYK